MQFCRGSRARAYTYTHIHAQSVSVLTVREIRTGVCSGILPAHVGSRDSGIPTCGQTNGLIKSPTLRGQGERQKGRERGGGGKKGGAAERRRVSEERTRMEQKHNARTVRTREGPGRSSWPRVVSYLSTRARAHVAHAQIFAEIYAARTCICISCVDVEDEIFPLSPAPPPRSVSLPRTLANSPPCPRENCALLLAEAFTIAGGSSR